ncbi:MAG: hypothetical protein ACE3JP_17060 [Ectobacillus sp.]
MKNKTSRLIQKSEKEEIDALEEQMMSEQTLLHVNFATTDNMYLAEREPRVEE